MMLLKVIPKAVHHSREVEMISAPLLPDVKRGTAIVIMPSPTTSRDAVAGAVRQVGSEGLPPARRP